MAYVEHSTVAEIREGQRVVAEMFSGNRQLQSVVTRMRTNFGIPDSAQQLFFGITANGLVIGARSHEFPGNYPEFRGPDIVVFTADVSRENPENAQGTLTGFPRGKYSTTRDGSLVLPSSEIMSQFSFAKISPARGLHGYIEQLYNQTGGPVVIPPGGISEDRVPRAGARFVHPIPVFVG